MKTMFNEEGRLVPYSKRELKKYNKRHPNTVYVVWNPAHPNYYKIGQTNRTYKRRLNSLNNPSVMENFETVLLFEHKTDTCLEKLLHHEYRKKRVPHKEFFKLDEDDLYDIQYIAWDQGYEIKYKGNIIKKIEQEEWHECVYDELIAWANEEIYDHQVQHQLELYYDELAWRGLTETEAREDGLSYDLDEAENYRPHIENIEHVAEYLTISEEDIRHVIQDKKYPMHADEDGWVSLEEA